jgi:DNA-directed RNA polymerase subunit M/transcription elongation factor TFIIS
MTYRDNGKRALGTVLTQEQNIRVLEKHIYAAVSKTKDPTAVEQAYRQAIYDTVGDISSGGKLSAILTKIKEAKIGWDHDTYTEWQKVMREQDDFIENPFEVAEGVLECNNILKSGEKCGSKRVFSYTKQVRSCDEGCTTFATCCKCGAKWQHRG